ncbi:GtrA family protein [Actinomyces slackii]|uniref:GtrA-like protein n=1 Tax=Actinomyces slackii TaxID=52774 RepID=A0A3S4U0E1_9ACTO|nr:GtrA family protein [Actinomyces slackii]VEG73428.1 GtrA-like protein [Actinomyces slackii]
MASTTAQVSSLDPRLPESPDRQAAPASRLAPARFHRLIHAIHRVLPGPLRRRVPVTFVGYAIINGSAFLLDIAFLWFFYEKLHWLYPVAVTVGYAIAGLYSLLLNRWLNFQAHGHLVAQGSRYAVGLVAQYVIFILGLSTFLHWMGMNAELARFLSACCEGVFLYVLLKIWVFRGTPEPSTASPASR